MLTICWLNSSDNRQELFGNSGQQQLLLQIGIVTSAINGTMYTCEVQVMLTTMVMRVIRETIILRVDGKQDNHNSVSINTIFIGANSPRIPTTSESVTPFSATIRWILTEPFNSSRPETFTLLYGNNETHLNMQRDGIMATSSSQSYSTQLSMLEPGIVHYYMIESRNKFESRSTSVMFFITDDYGKY